MTMRKGVQKVVLDGRGLLTLRESDYVTSGGEGSIYRANETIIKLYLDPNKMQRDRMGDKVKLLSKITHPSIVAPQGMVLNEKGKPIGFYMPYVSGEPLSRIFVSDFRTRVGFLDKDSITLVDKMRDTVQYAHTNKVMLVDANELNWLVELNKKQGPKPIVIDVDSWVFEGNIPASVPKMLSIKDPIRNPVSYDADWFAWGVVTFQVFTGIHPYKGRADGYKPGELERRMKDGVSVFVKDVHVPHSVRDFNLIPSRLLDWYIAVFQKGERSVPPSPYEKVVLAPKAAQVVRMVTNVTGQLTYTKVYGHKQEEIVQVWPCGIAKLSSGILLDMKTNQDLGKLESREGEVVQAANGYLVADKINGIPEYKYIEGSTVTKLPTLLSSTKFLRSGDRLFVMTDRELVELQLRVLGKPVLTAGKRWSISPNATRIFDNLAIVDVLGNTFLYLPQPDGGMIQVRTKELDGLTPISAKAGNRFVAVLCVDKKGDYKKFEFTFDKSYATYACWSVSSDIPLLNMAILPTGVVATIVTDGELCIYVPTNGQLRKLSDSKINTALQLGVWGDKVVCLKDGQVWRVQTN